MKLKCVIVDDEPNAVNLLHGYVNRVHFLELEATFYNSTDLINYCQGNHTDVVFLDIQLPGLSGLDTIEYLRTNTSVVFTTAYSNYAVESYEKSAVDYLLKPITFQRFLTAAKKCLDRQMQLQKIVNNEQHPTATKYIFIKSGKRLTKVEYERILYLKAEREYIAVITDTEKILYYRRMKDLVNEMPPNFVRVHNSYIVNLDHINKIEDNQIQIGGQNIPVSDSYRSIFLKNINKRKI